MFGRAAESYEKSAKRDPREISPYEAGLAPYYLRCAVNCWNLAAEAWSEARSVTIGHARADRYRTAEKRCLASAIRCTTAEVMLDTK